MLSLKSVHERLAHRSGSCRIRRVPNHPTEEEAATTVRQQNRFWRKTYGPREVKHNERAAVGVGIFAIVLALIVWVR
jgi:hypothetical protein